ncbi:hypothetical protein M0M57_06100 [Flavobacterium azooxidireducens]|uniref:Uncharacterized protein n=1 Tax=Flavobacterium azooxidireducens TaxID=1871076 RepID=A0ABY4KL60_9FLAO|nr:hypothetical protein [Flavobacterium azooxidireducens]UPQ80408.1 hypothetical protein M0M57_06100 [Flavobacterium azooxidireducens]
MDTEIQKKEIDSNKVNRIEKDSIENEVKSNIKVIVLQCSNGYGHNDFNRTIESEISKKEGFTIVPFPNKKLVGVTFQGVYDKKYCIPIIERIDVDYIVMTRFLGNIEEAVEIIDENFVWGYEIKILNTKSMNQKISIRKDNLAKYKDLLTDIEKNGEKLLNDIENLK